MRSPTRALPLLALVASCSAAPPPPAEVALPPSVPPQVPGDVKAAEPPRVARPWEPPWRVVEAFRGASVIFAPTMDLCASGPARTRCLGSTDLGPVAGSVLSSPTQVWGFVYVCGVGPQGDFLCNKPPADRPQQGPPRLADLAGVTVHAAVHRDGTVSVTTNRDFSGWMDPRWAKVDAVTDAVEIASSWYAARSCYRRRSGEVACVDHAKDASPKAVPGVTDAARLWKTDAVLWILTRAGELLATRNPSRPPIPVASAVVDFVPNAAAPGAKPPDPEKGSENPEVPCAVNEDGRLLCGLGRDWTLLPVPGAGTTRRVFGGSDWICALDDAGTARCVRSHEASDP